MTTARNLAAFGTTAANYTGRNRIINGGFDVWQRGTSFSNPAGDSYTADRWSVEHDGTGATRTVSQQAFTPGSAPVAGYEGTYFLRYAVSNAGSSNTYQDINQRIEGVRTLAGQTVTLSFWAKASSTLTLQTLSRSYYGSSGSTGDQISIGSVSVTTSWQRFTQTYTTTSVSGKTIAGGNDFLQIRFRPPANSTLSLDLWGVQLEAGPAATPFEFKSYGQELRDCQRYYYRTSAAGGAYARFGYGTAASATTGYGNVILPVPMRTIPTSMEMSNVALASGGGGLYALSSPSLQQSSPNIGFFSATASGLTASAFYEVIANASTSAYIGFSAEL